MQKDVPSLTSLQKELLREGVEVFNREEFFECHEILEKAWLDACGQQKRFLQGLIQVAVAFHHLKRGNLIGANRLLAAGIEKLSDFSPHQEQLDVGGLLQTIESFQKQIGSGEIPPDW